MNRDVTKSMPKFDKYIKKHDKYDIYMSEMDQLFMMSNGDPFYLMTNGYKHGFIVGYRAALRDLKKKEGRC